MSVFSTELAVMAAEVTPRAARIYNRSGASFVCAPRHGFFRFVPFSILADMNATTVVMNGGVGSAAHELNWIESLWEGMYEGRDPLIVTGVFAFLMHEIVYFGRFLPFLICDFIPYFQRYKLQPVSASLNRKWVIRRESANVTGIWH